MHVIAVNPNPVGLSELTISIKELHPSSTIAAFSDPMLAVKYGISSKADALYTAIDMKRLNGFEVAKMLREDNVNLLVNFIAKDLSFKQDAMRLGMNSYTVEPVTADRLRESGNEIW